jgi:hypothetical protein
LKSCKTSKSTVGAVYDRAYFVDRQLYSSDFTGCASGRKAHLSPLQRMLIKGWVTAEWGITSGNRRARYYRITKLGPKQLATEGLQFDRVIGAIKRALKPAEEDNTYVMDQRAGPTLCHDAQAGKAQS